MPEVNYKLKYDQLKQRFMNSVEAAFQLGIEQGLQQAQVQQAQQAQADAQAAQEAAMGGGMPGEEGAPGEEGEQPGQPGEAAPPGAPGAQPPQSAHPDGSELDQHIAELESLLGKSANDPEQYESLKKSIEGLKSLQNGIKLKSDLAKGDAAIKVIAKSMNAGKRIGAKPRAMAPQAQANLGSNAKAALALQEKIVSDVMKSFGEEESASTKLIQNIVAQEGASKKG